ncbi:MAG: hypothetical protein GMKNLPBB_02724 [Myxococcota bacterium]|nr:hypothetical protein [Myxococcota bacterium]
MSETTLKSVFDGISSRLAGKSDLCQKINAGYQFDLGGAQTGKYFIDLTGSEPKVGEGELAGAKCTITMTGDDFIAMVAKKSLNPQMAFMTGKLKVKGDMGLALKLQTVLNAS